MKKLHGRNYIARQKFKLVKYNNNAFFCTPDLKYETDFYVRIAISCSYDCIWKIIHAIIIHNSYISINPS